MSPGAPRVQARVIGDHSQASPAGARLFLPRRLPQPCSLPRHPLAFLPALGTEVTLGEPRSVWVSESGDLASSAGRSSVKDFGSFAADCLG